MKRLAIKLLLLFLLGAIVNVAVAWGCLNGVPRQAGYSSRSNFWLRDGRMHSARVIQRFGMAMVVYEAGVELDSSRFANLVDHFSKTSYTDFDPTLVPPHRSFAGAVLQGQATESMQAVVNTYAGFPALSMTCRITFGSGGADWWSKPPVLDSGVLISGVPGEWNRVLPFRPIWTSFAINTIFYAGILWLLFAGPGTLRRFRRRRRGQCIHCGYDLRGQPAGSSKCPECGQNQNMHTQKRRNAETGQ